MSQVKNFDQINSQLFRDKGLCQGRVYKLKKSYLQFEVSGVNSKYISINGNQVVVDKLVAYVEDLHLTQYTEDMIFDIPQELEERQFRLNGPLYLLEDNEDDEDYNTAYCFANLG